MKTLLQNLLRQIVVDFVSKTFTLDNVKAFRDIVLEQLKEKVKQTDTTLDDWGTELVVKILSDANIEMIYSWIIDTVKPLGENRCGFTPEQFDTLASTLNITPDGCDNVCATPSIAQIISLLEIFVPILIDWFKTI